MNDPKQLLQIIHDRGEEAQVSGRVHDQARAATRELVKWIEAQLAKEAPPPQPLHALPDQT